MSEIQVEKSGRMTIPAHAAREIGERPMRLADYSEYHLLLETEI